MSIAQAKEWSSLPFFFPCPPYPGSRSALTDSGSSLRASHEGTIEERQGRKRKIKCAFIKLPSLKATKPTAKCVAGASAGKAWLRCFSFVAESSGYLWAGAVSGDGSSSQGGLESAGLGIEGLEGKEAIIAVFLREPFETGFIGRHLSETNQDGQHRRASRRGDLLLPKRGPDKKAY
jgi:hypothetical protein